MKEATGGWTFARALPIAVVLVMSTGVSAQRTTQAVPLVQTVYVSVLDQRGLPVAGLTAADFILREGGDIREILKVEPASALLHVAIVVDDSGTGIFRVPVANFVNQLLGRARFAIKHVIGQAQRLVDYTSDVDQLRNAILRLGVRAETPEGGRVVEAVFDTSKELRDVERGVIVVLTDTHSEYSSLSAQHVLSELRESGAVLYVFSVIRRPVSTAIVPRTPVSADKPSDLLDHQLDINQVLGDGPRQTGGRRVEIGGLGGTIPAFQAVAAELRGQYLITYLVPAGKRLNQRLRVSTRSRGVSVHAPWSGRRGVR